MAAKIIRITENMDIKEQIARITRYENMMIKAERLMGAELSKDGEDELRAIMGELEAYYTGKEWMSDFACDEAGLLPPELKRGVLSEDGLYDLIEAYGELKKEKESGPDAREA